MFNIDNFKSSIEKNSYLQTNKFKVIIPVPPSISQHVVGQGEGDVGKLLTFRAEAVKAPGITLNSDQVYRYGIGTQQQMPYSASYTDNVISFISDGRGTIWNFWYLWIRSIFGFAGNDSFTGGGNFNTMPDYQVEYKENYATEISVIIFDNFGNEIQTINMYDAFPISFNDVQLNWADNNNLLRVTVGFTFKEFTVDGAGMNALSSNIPPRPKIISPTISSTNPTTPSAKPNTF